MNIKHALFQKIDIVELSEKYLGASFESGKSKCIHPDHDDNNPSMVYSDFNKPHFKCWVCKSSGRQWMWDCLDLAALILQAQGAQNSYPHCIRFLCQYAGIPLEDDDFDTQSKNKSKLETLFDEAVYESKRMLRNGAHPQIAQFLDKRGIHDPTVIECIGVAPNMKGKRPFGQDVASWYDPLQKDGAIILPIRNDRHELIGLKLRSASLNSNGLSEKRIFTLGRADGYIGTKRFKDKCLIVEGEMDMLHLMQILGIDSVKSTGGASNSMLSFTEIKGIDAYLVIPDNDQPDPSTGMVAGHSIAHNLAKRGMATHVACVPNQFKDVEDAIGDVGQDAFMSHIQNSTVPYGEFLAKWRFMGAKEYVGAMLGMKFFSQTWDLARDLSTVLDKSSFIQSASSITGLSTKEIRDQLEPTREYTKGRMLERISEILESDMSKSNKLNLIGTEAYDHFASIGLWVKDGRVPMYIHGGQMMPVLNGERGGLFQSHLFAETGINPESRDGKEIIGAIRMMALYESNQIVYKANSYCDRETSTLYLGIDRGTVIKITPLGIEECRNGTDGVMVTWMDYYRKLNFNPNADKRDAVKFLKEKINDRFSCEEYLRPLITSFFISSYLRDYIIGQRGILHVTGGQGAGKTSAISLANLLLFGDTLNRGIMTDAAMRTSSGIDPVVLYDNWELKNLTKEREQFLLTSATGSTSLKREMNTDRGLVAEDMNSLSIVTSIEPWGTPELKSRKFMVKFDKSLRKHDEMVSMSALQDEILTNRDSVLSGLIRVIAEDIISHINGSEYKKDQEQWAGIIKTHGPLDKDRIVPMFSLLFFIAKKLNSVYPHFFDSPDELFSLWVEYLCDADEEDRIQDNDLIPYLDKLSLLLKHPSKHSLDYDSELDVWQGTADSFWRAFRFLDTLQGVPREDFPWRSAQSLGVRAKRMSDDLESSGYIFKIVGQHSTSRINIWRAKVPSNGTLIEHS